MAAAVGAILVGPGIAQAQEGGDVVAARRGSRARIGVYLEERCEVRAGAAPGLPGSCDQAPIVRSVTVGGPADLAGVQAGDTLLAIDGVPIASAAGRGMLAELEVGQEVSIEVGRGSGRSTIDIVPEVMAPAAWVTVRARPEGAGAGLRELRVVRIPEVQVPRPAPELAPGAPHAEEGSMVLFHEDSLGTFRVEVGVGDSLPGDLTHLDGVRRYVWRNEQLARRLREVRQSSLRTARIRLDSLLHAHGRLLVQVKEGGGQGREVIFAPRSDWSDREPHAVARERELPGKLRVLFVPDRRVAGAEFRELTAELGEYFEGADGGLLVLRVLPGTPAARLGLRGGDVVVEAGGKICNDIDTLRGILEGRDEGGVDVKWIRKGTAHSGRLIDL